MNNGVRLALTLGGAAVVAGSPFLWWWHPGLLWLAALLVAAWAVWLMFGYLRWARTLRQR